MNTVSGLQTALKLYASEKVKERSQGHEHIREIFGNRENLAIFQETASREGGAGWIALFQCLFQVVVVEKRAVMKKIGSAQADRRLAEAISLVRWMTERSVHLLSRKPFLAIFTHMIHLLVYGSAIFPPTALDYAKALRSLLSYPPHLENLDQQSWKVLMGICWSTVLGDPVTIDDEWQDAFTDQVDEPGPSNGRTQTADMATQGGANYLKRSSVSQATSELVSLIPILLSSTAAPLLPPLPDKDAYHQESSLGLAIIMKIHRFFTQQPSESSIHLPILRSLNTVLAEIELNCRNELVLGGMKVLPQLVALWGTRSKGIREQLLIAFGILLPYLTHKSALERDKLGVVREALTRLVETIPREALTRWGIEPLDMAVLRLKLGNGSNQPYRTRVFAPGFDFSHECAMTWAILELYADCCYQLYKHVDTPSSATPTATMEGRSAKRRKVDNALSALLTNLEGNTLASRLIHLQVLIFMVDRHWGSLHAEAHTAIRQAIIDTLDDEYPALQCWGLVGVATLATLTYHDGDPSGLVLELASPSRHNALRQGETAHWTKAWAHAMRKVPMAPLSRAASIAALSLLVHAKISIVEAVRDIGPFLRSIDISGPPHPFDSVCAFLTAAMNLARADAQLYSLNLEDKVLAWLGRWTALEGSRGKTRMDLNTPLDMVQLLGTCCQLQSYPFVDLTVNETLPDCAIVERVMVEAETQALRRFVLEGHIPTAESPITRKSSSTASSQSATLDGHSQAFLDGRNRLASAITAQALDSFCTDFAVTETTAVSPPERLRRAIDMAVTGLAFQATLQLHGISTDNTCIQLGIQLIKCIQPIALSASYSIPGQHLIWRGLAPLVYTPHETPESWPILLKPDVNSGLRRDILPPGRYASAEVQGRDSGIEKIQQVLWRMPSVAAAMTELCVTAQSLIEGNASTLATITQASQVNVTADDDFGEIRTADADAMPQSSEVLECQRTTASLLNTIVHARLKGAVAQSVNRLPQKDTRFVNSFIASEGLRFIQLGRALCDAIVCGILRLSADAVDCILGAFEEMLSSYAYSRDDALVRLCFDFLSASMPVWLAPELADSDVAERAIHLVQFLVSKSSRGSSWRVRLGVIILIDEYLEYDPSYSVWTRLRDEDMDVDGEAFGPLGTISNGLIDRDARVRFRAATSSAGLFYLPSLSFGRQRPFYFDIVQKQPGQTHHWDSFITDLLWKLNCCVVSAELRAAAIYHLYEIPLSTSDFNHHLHVGLQKAAERLGLDGAASLYLTHAVVILESQMREGQSALRIPHKAYGFTSRKNFAIRCLEVTAPAIIASGIDSQMTVAARDLLGELCRAAGVSSMVVASRALPPAMAIGLVRTGSGSTKLTNDSATSALLSQLALTYGWNAEGGTTGIPSPPVEGIAANLFAYLDASIADEYLKPIFDANHLDWILYHELAGSDTVSLMPALDPRVPLAEMPDAYSSLKKANPSMSTTKITFTALTDLFTAINNVYLISEQHRYLRAVAILVVVHVDKFRHPTILNAFLHELLELLIQPDLSAMVLSMLRWGMKQVKHLSAPLPDLKSILLRLGAIRTELVTSEFGSIGDALEEWVRQDICEWHNIPVFPEAIQTSSLLWPESLAAQLPKQTLRNEDILTLCEFTSADNAMTLCRRIADVSKTTNDSLSLEFGQEAFWSLKESFEIDKIEPDGATAFLELLHYVAGRISAPALSDKGSQDAASKIVTKAESAPAQTKGDLADSTRTAVITRLVDLTSAPGYRVRAAALQALRGLLSAASFASIKDQKELSSSSIRLLELIIPQGVALGGQEESTLATLATDDNWIKKAHSASSWSSALADLLCQVTSLDEPIYHHLRPLLLLTIGVSATSFIPLLIRAVLSGSGVSSRVTIKDRSQHLSAYFTALLQSSTTSTEVVQAIVKTVLHLRNFDPPHSSQVLQYNQWLQIDYLLLSDGAIKCKSYTTALLFLELAISDHYSSGTPSLFDSRVQNAMYKIYSNVEDPDGFYGIKTQDVQSALLRRLDHEGEYWRAFGLHAANVENKVPAVASLGASISAVHQLHSLGFNRLSGAVMSGLRAGQIDTSASDPVMLDMAWRNGDWDLPMTSESSQTSSGLLFSAVRAVHRERDQLVAANVVFQAVKREMLHLKVLGPERMTEVQNTVTSLLCLREVVTWLSPATQAAISSAEFGSEHLRQFCSLKPSLEFRTAERLVATRLSLFDAALERERQSLIGDMTTPQMDGVINLQRSCYLQLGQLARAEGNIQAAVNAVAGIQGLEGGKLTEEAEEEFSQVLWLQQEHSLALQHAEQRISRLGTGMTGNRARIAIMQGRIAHWCSLAKSRAPTEINDMFRTAHDAAVKYGTSVAEQAQLAYDYAVFADAHQASLAKSPELEQLLSYVSRKRDELESATTTSAASKRRESSSRSLQAQTKQGLKEDEAAIEEFRRGQTDFVKIALRFYAATLAMSNEHDDITIRICSLWLENDSNNDVNRQFSPALGRIPSYKFIFLGPQLAARLDRPKQPTDFNVNLNRLLLRLSQEHPYHILYQVITLASGYTAPSNGRRLSDNAAEGRGPAAVEILSTIAGKDGNLLARSAAKDMRIFSDAAIDWSLQPPDNDAPQTSMGIVLPPKCPLKALSGLKIPVATNPPPISLDGDYSKVSTLVRYKSHYGLLGGLHRPKKVKAIDSEGRIHSQIFKGEDEVRQDAVMEQVFEMSNKLLLRDRKAKSRHLRFRTYVVIPLARKTGVLEFVGDSQGIGDWLKPAHSRYGKPRGDISSDAFRTKLKPIQEKDHNSSKLLPAYHDMIKKFGPVMRHFFTEKHRDPVKWFAMRLNYSRSVAVTSMVGWVLGIGDRHCSNIMIDSITGEVIHIDFGIVFEEGQRLRIPEKIPFRLTNDIVDGLGVTGVDGTFRQCSEHTLRVLRESSNLIMTVLEVFKHDPLYAWTGDPDKLKRAQGGGHFELNASSATVQEKADRVLSRIRQKLRGDLSVEYTVNQLIQEARNEESLAKIFVGWQPWL